MQQKTFSAVVGAVFLIIALLHLARVVYQWDAFINVWFVPMWVSWVAIVGVGLIGRAWANVFSRAGWNVQAWDANPEATKAAPDLVAASLKDLELDTLLPGVKINTSPTDFAPISQLQMMRFKGDKWELFGDIISGDVAPE